jgi:hypothetical protein
MSMIERVEKAILTALQKEAAPSDLARAAIEAMREPTEAMVASGESAASFGIGKPKDDAAIPRVWRWMIDAALSNSKGGEG